MPAVSEKQERFMQAVANNPKFAKKAGVPQSVGREFTKGDKMKCGSKKMADGGTPASGKKLPYQSDEELNKISPEARAMMEQKKKDMEQEKKQKDMEDKVRSKKYARGGGIEHKGKTRGKMVKMATGGSVGKASKRADGIATKGKTKCKMV